MKIRVAVKSDAEAIRGLVASLSHFYLQGGARTLPEWFAMTLTVDEFEKRLKANDFYSLVCEEGGRIVGYISMKNKFHLYHLFVSEKYQGKGIARALWSQVVMQFGIARYTVRSSLYAVPVYKAFGFMETGPVQTKDGIAFQPMELPGVC